jgi:curved DNA-binding protein CbpA
LNVGKDAYKVLQVDPRAELIVIHAAYRALARHCHPDGVAPDPARMAELNRAYAEIRDPESRQRYDTRRAMETMSAVPFVGQQRVDGWTPRAPRDAASPTVIDFGRYHGWRIADLARHDPDYLRWLCRHSSGLRFREAILRVLPSESDLQRRSNAVA